MANLTELEALVAQLAAINFSQSSEQATREMAVNPLIAALGWNTFDPDEVDREFSVRGGRVDYCLRGPKGNLVLIEVKRTGTDLIDHQEQLLRYAFDEGVQMAALTDGLVWWLYLPMASGNWEQRRFAGIELQERGPRQAASQLDRFLNRDGVMNGTAIEQAQREFESQARERLVRSALRKAWIRILNDPASLLRDLLAEGVEEIAGHVPDEELIDEFLADVTGNEGPNPVSLPSKREQATLPTTSATSNARTASAAERKTQGRGRKDTTARLAGFRLDGELHEVKSWRGMLVRVCELLASDPGQPFLERVAGLRGRKNLYFSASGEGLRTPVQLSGMGMFVEGNVSARAAERLARRTVETIRGSDHGFSIEYVGERVAANKAAPSAKATGKGRARPTSESFTGLRASAYWLDGERFEVSRWNEVLHGMCDRLAREAGSDFGKLVSPIRGRTRAYFSENPEELHLPLRLSNSSYVDGNFSANGCVRLARRVLVAVRGTDTSFDIEPERDDRKG